MCVCFFVDMKIFSPFSLFSVVDMGVRVKGALGHRRELPLALRSKLSGLGRRERVLGIGDRGGVAGQYTSRCLRYHSLSLLSPISRISCPSPAPGETTLGTSWGN